MATRLSVGGVSEAPRTGTVTSVSINTLCNVMGAGVLSLPLSFYRATIGLGVGLMLFVALMSFYSVYCLVVGCDATGRYSFTEVMAFSLFPPRTFDAFCASRLGSVSSVTEESRDEAAGELIPSYSTLHREHKLDELYRRQRRRVTTVLVEIILFLSNFGALVLYAKVIADSLPPVVAHTLPVGRLFVSGNFWLVASGVVFFALSCARNMEELKWSSLLGFLTIFYVVVAVSYRYYTAVSHGYPYVEQRGDIVWMGLPMTALRVIPTYGVAFGYHFNVPYFYRELRERTPTEMMHSVWITCPIIVVCYIATGLFGYLTFGNEVANAKVGGSIINNYAKDDVLMNVGRLGLFAHFACVFPVVSICCRRSLHRLLMTTLTWYEQSEMMQTAAGVLELPSSSLFTTEETALLLPLNVPLSAEELDRDVGSPDDTTRVAIILEAAVLVATAVALAGTVSGIAPVIDVTGTLFGLFLILIGPGIIGSCIFSTSFMAHQAYDNYDGQGALPYTTLLPRYWVRGARLKRILCAFSVLTGIFFTVIGTINFICQMLRRH